MADNSRSNVATDVEEEPLQGSKRLGIYVLPNLFTTGSLFAGFYAIISAMHQQFNHAALAIMIAMFLDGLDGRVARLINAQSEFGAHYDSLSDLVSFGVAPALVLYNWALVYLSSYGMAKVAWLSAFFYVACVALRLAKFNSLSQENTVAKRYFFGLPCPAAAGLVAMSTWFVKQFAWSGMSFYVLMTMITILLAFLMVSNIKYRSFKDFSLKDRVRFYFSLMIVIVIVAITLAPVDTLFFIFALYVLSGPVGGLLRLRQKSKMEKGKK